jgi:hypothetical protein
VPRHVDRRAEAALVEERRQAARLRLEQQRRGDREPTGVELLVQLLPWERVDALLEREPGRGGGGGGRRHTGETPGRRVL